MEGEWQIIISHRACLGCFCLRRGHRRVHDCCWFLTLYRGTLFRGSRGPCLGADGLLVREGSVADDEEDSFEIDDGSFDDGAVLSRQSEDGHFGPSFEGATMAG